MITFKKFGKTVKIRNDDWKKLKERFSSVEKAHWSSLDKKYCLPGSCPLCNRYHCPLCPFYVFDEIGNEEVTCVEFLKKLFNPLYFDSGTEEITWSRTANKKARKQLGQLQKMMDKIEASQ